MKSITFTDVTQQIPFLESPRPASESIPDWYKNMAGYIGKATGGSTEKEIYISEDGIASKPQTMKRCVPIFDALTAGYIIKTICDVQVTQRDGLPYYKCPQNYEVITFHGREQAAGNPGTSFDIDIPKWTNPWAIKTPPGYSSLIVPPLNNQNTIFEIFSGVVDTDKYDAPIHFPFRLLNWNFEGVIPAGTPMAQVIPFKQDSFKMQIGNEESRELAVLTSSKLKNYFYNFYRNNFWSRKSYK
jgi:hypothetical protein